MTNSIRERERLEWHGKLTRLRPSCIVNEDELGVSAFLESVAPSDPRRSAVLGIGYKAKLYLVDFEFLPASRV